jgi:hypothetical protein
MHRRRSAKVTSGLPALRPLSGHPLQKHRLLRQVTKSGISGMLSANLRINRPVGFLPCFFKPAFQFVTTVSGGDAAPEPFTCCQFRPQNEIIESALRKQVKLLPNDNL